MSKISISLFHAKRTWKAISFIPVFLLFLSGPVYAQMQLGADIDGEAADDLSGWSVSLSADGNRLAIGARLNDGNGVGAGHTRVYEWSGSAWQQLGTDLEGEAAGDLSGYSVSLSAEGSRLAIGAIRNGTDAGHTRVYEWSGSAWQQLGTDIDGEAVRDTSGVTVSLSADGSRLAIGATLNDDNGTNSGHTRVYEWSELAWQQLGSDIDGEASGDLSGGSVSLSADGNRLAIGARRNAGNGANTDAGHTRVYEWSGSAWQQLGTDIDGEREGDLSGFSVSLSAAGDRVAIGSPHNEDNGTLAGQTRVYQWSGLAWQQLGTDIVAEAQDNLFGNSVSLSADGNLLAIGAKGNDNNGTDTGHTRVYEWSGSAWQQLGTDIDGEAAGDFSGHAVSLSADGSLVAIGAIWNDGNGEDSGHVRIFTSSDDVIFINSFESN